MRPTPFRSTLGAGFALLLLLSWGSPGPASASALDLFGFGARSPAMGATGVAHAAGFEAAYANPAGLTFQRNKRLSVGYLFGRFDLAASSNLLRIRTPRAEDASALVIGVAIPLGLRGWLKDKMYVGMGFYLPTGVVTRARVPFPGQPFFGLLESRTQVVGVQIAGAIEPYPGLKIGAGVLALAALAGTVILQSDAAGNIGTTVEQELIVDYAPIVGVIWVPEWIKRWSFGVVYRGESQATFDIDLLNQLGSALPIGLPAMRIAGVAQYDPQQAAVEAAWRPRRGTLVALQLCWKDWSRYPQPTVNVTQASPALPELGFRDTVVVRAGFEQVFRFRKWRFAARAGYFFEPTPTPEQRGLTNIVDNHRQVFTVGGGAAFLHQGRTPFSIDVFVQYHHMLARSHHKDPERIAPSDPTAPRPDPVIVQFARSRFRTWGQIVVASAVIGVEF